MIHIVKGLTVATNNPKIIAFQGGAGHIKIDVAGVQYVNGSTQNFFAPEVYIDGVKSAGGYFKVKGPTNIELRVPNVQWSPIPQGDYTVPDFSINYVPDEKEIFKY